MKTKMGARPLKNKKAINAKGPEGPFALYASGAALAGGSLFS
jgi:hypothetical protein